jgi:hypothetical protein
MSYQLLFFNSVDLANGINFPKCPNPECNKPFKNTTVITSAKNGLSASKADFNGLVDFTCPNCNAKISFYVAVHRYTSSDFGLCIQKSSEEGASGIPANWWIREKI